MTTDQHEANTRVRGFCIPASLALLGATILALIVANSALAPLYKGALTTDLEIGIGAFAIEHTVKDWIKNAR